MRQDDDKLIDTGRRFFLGASLATLGVLTPGTVAAEQQRGRGRGAERKEEEEEDVAPPEDLMREHGVLKRVLLVYEEAIRRIDVKQDFPPDA